MASGFRTASHLSFILAGTAARPTRFSGQLRVIVCHPDDGSVSDGRNGPRTASRKRSRFRFQVARLGRATLLGRLLRERDFLHVVALLYFVDRVHPLNHAAKHGVLPIESRLRLEADVELAAARI